MISSNAKAKGRQSTKAIEFSEVMLDTDFEEEPVSAIMGYMDLTNKDCSGDHNALATRLRLAVKYLDAVAV